MKNYLMGYGARLVDVSRPKRAPGRRFIDLTAGGIFCCMFGPGWYKFQSIFDKPNPVHLYSHRFGNYWLDRYKEALHELTGFTSFVIYTSGTEAVEAFLRVAWAYTGKSGVWGGLVDPDQVGVDKPVCDQFHGWTLGSRILAGRMTWHELGVYPELGMARFGNAATSTACMAMEPYHAPSGQFHKVDPTINRIVTLRKEYPDILFLIDEIQGGFGRTGKLFAYEHYTDNDNNYMLHPDFVTLGKLAGGGFPLSVLCGPSEILESKSVIEHAYLHSTHSGNPMTCCVGTHVIEAMIKKDLIVKSYNLGKKMHEYLAKLPIRTHGKGLMVGLEFRDDIEAHKVVVECEKRGVIVVDTGRKWVKIGPALIISEDLLMRALEIVKEVIDEVLSDREDAKKEGVIRTKDDVTPCGITGQGSENINTVMEIPRFQIGVERIAESSEDAGQEGPDDGTGTGELAPPCGS